LTDPNTSKAATDFYDLVKNSQEAVNAVNRMKKEGRVEELKDFISDEENIKLMSVAPSLRRIQDQMAQVRRKSTYLNGTMKVTPKSAAKKLTGCRNYMIRLPVKGIESWSPQGLVAREKNALQGDQRA
jgi:hypothetical protein